MRKFKLSKRDSNDLLIKDYPAMSYDLVFTLTGSYMYEDEYFTMEYEGGVFHVPEGFIEDSMTELPLGWGIKVPNAVEELL